MEHGTITDLAIAFASYLFGVFTNWIRKQLAGR
jgi:hypothetical protein